MINKNEGYFDGSNYLYGYFAELDPQRLKLALLNFSLAAPSFESACELGFGQGVSINLHAAASTTRWFGTDFNAAHAVYANSLAAASGASATLLDESFATFCKRPDLPDFDFICLHGIWSWVSENNRNIIVDFIRRKLRDGGVLYVGYNTLAGHGAFQAAQHLITGFVEQLRTSGQSPAEAIAASLELTEKLVAASPGYLAANPQVAARFGDLRKLDSVYVAHEYVNRDWTPTSFGRVADKLAVADLSYACPASFFDAVDAWNLTAEQRMLLGGIADEGVREMARDILMNRWFRKDYWVRNPRRLTAQEKTERFRRQQIVLVRPHDSISLKVSTGLGNFVPQQSVSDPILEVLSDHRPKTLEQIERAVGGRGIGLDKIVEIVMVLVELGAASPAQSNDAVESARSRVKRLNGFLCDQARHGLRANVLASPLTGGGIVALDRVTLLFLNGLQQGIERPQELADHAVKLLRAEGANVTDGENRFLQADGGFDALTIEAGVFLQRLAPVLRAVKVL